MKTINVLKTLVSMQLKEKLNLKGRSKFNKRTAFGMIFAVLKFALIVGLCFVFLFLARKLQLFSLTGILPTSIVTVVFTVMLLISIVATTMSLTKSMYYSHDNPVLLTLPCKASEVYLSKLIVYYIYELIRNFSFMVPMFIAFGVISKFSFIYYIWLLICFVFISMIPVVIGALLSIPGMWFYDFFRQYKRLQLGCLIALIGLIVISVVKAIAIIPKNIDLLGTWGTTYWQIQDFLKAFTNNFSVFHRVVEMIVGVRAGLHNKIFVIDTFITLAILLISIVALFMLGIVVVKPLFYKMASKPFEYRKDLVKAKQNKILPKRATTYKTELLLNIRQPERIFSSVGVLIALPILIFFLNKMFMAMSTRLLGDNMSISFNILIILLVALTSNSYAASAFSKDGRSSYLIKVQPSKYQPLLLAKLSFNSVTLVLSFIATFIVVYLNTGLGFAKALVLILSCIAIYFAHLFYSAELDIMNPQTELYATIGNTDNNPNETKSTLMAFLISFLVFGLFLLLLIENNSLFTYLKLFAVSLVMMISRLYLFLNKIKLYYMEK